MWNNCFYVLTKDFLSIDTYTQVVYYGYILKHLKYWLLITAINYYF